MKPITSIDVVGLGALGVLYADYFTRALGKEHVRVLANRDRMERYRREGVILNGRPCDFQYADAASESRPAELLLFSVKFGALKEAMAEVAHLVGPDTTIISILNGISSEQLLGEAFGAEKIVWCVSQKAAALKEGNRASVRGVGTLALGIPAGQDPERFRAVVDFMNRTGFPCELPEDIHRHMWSKLLCNTGCNQVVMVYEGDYSTIQCPGEARDRMIAAMEEVVQVANAEGVALSEADVQMWVSVLDGFDPGSEPSMRQDGKAHRKSEVELFSGTIRRLAAKHGIPVPVNDWLYEKVAEMEGAY
ncbi:ketopantoate reductase family protein [Dysosmobacter sp.]|uniref:ketopantoate reductase family protein n=1 Tax=Dysosmobacter sp. TaxID=2591382 RepID=UPI002A891D8D|nr:ketopantoate reductase family protein [Dysosmobacter sp.]MDY3280951.1 ketopantoate reductase family protein [Dysosmobacter sp.]